MRAQKRGIKQSNPPLRDLEILLTPTAELRPLGREKRQHQAEQINGIAEIVRAYGVALPILVDSKNRVVDGWALVLAARQLGMAQIPVVSNTDLSETQLRALRIALNRISEYSRWNDAELRLEIQEIFQVEADLPLGIDVPTLDLLLDGTGSDEEDDYPAIDEEVNPQCKRGDQFICGKHIIRCDDALFASSYAMLLGRDQAGMVFCGRPLQCGDLRTCDEVTSRRFRDGSGGALAQGV